MKNKTILITGGTGSLGYGLVRELLDFNAFRIIIYSRNEHQQVLMRNKFNNPKLHYIIGDIRDYKRLVCACERVDYVIHTAAMKHVDICELNPSEAISINVHGTENVIQACKYNGVDTCVLISTDKAVNPISLYGATKLCAEKLFLAPANLHFDTCLGVIRFGNFMGSSGSVLPVFKDIIDAGGKELPITDPRMSRFFIEIKDAAKFILKTLKSIQHSDIYVPKMTSVNIEALAKQNFPNYPVKYVGKKTAEKLQEDLIIDQDVYDTPDSYIISNHYYSYPRINNFTLRS